MGTRLQETSDFHSTTKREQPSLQKQQKAVSYVGDPFYICIDTVEDYPQKYLRIIQVRTGNNLQGLQRAPVVHMKKEVFLLGSDRANPSLQQMQV